MVRRHLMASTTALCLSHAPAKPRSWQNEDKVVGSLQGKDSRRVRSSSIRFGYFHCDVHAEEGCSGTRVGAP